MRPRWGPKNSRSPGLGSSPLGRASVAPNWSPASRGSETPCSASTCCVNAEQSNPSGVRPPQRYGTPSSRRTLSSIDGRHPIGTIARDSTQPRRPSGSSPVPAPCTAGHEPRVQDHRTHRRTAAGPLPHLGERHGDPRAGAAHPLSRPATSHPHHAPGSNPAAVPIGAVFHPQPPPPRARGEDSHHLAHQELARELALVIGPAPNVQGREAHHPLPGPRGHHSIAGFMSTNLPNPSRSANTKRR